MGTKQLRGFKAITGEKPSKVAYGGRDSETMSSCSSFIFQMLGQQLLLPVKSRCPLAACCSRSFALCHQDVISNEMYELLDI